MPRKVRTDVLEAVENLIKLHLSASEIGRRVNKMFDQLAESKGNDQLRVSERQVQRYVAKVYARLEDDNVKYKPMRRCQMRQSLEAAFQKAMRGEPRTKDGKVVGYIVKPDLKAAIMALDRIAKLDGLYAPEQLNITGDMKHDHQHEARAQQMTTDERRSRLDELFSAYDKPLNGPGTNGTGTNGSGNGHDHESDPGAAN